MSDLVIRAATADDAPAISALVQHTVRISNGRDYPPQAVELIVANFAPAKVGQRMAERDVFVCQKGGRIVGTIALGARCSSIPSCSTPGSARAWSAIWRRTREKSA